MDMTCRWSTINFLLQVITFGIAYAITGSRTIAWASAAIISLVLALACANVSASRFPNDHMVGAMLSLGAAGAALTMWSGNTVFALMAFVYIVVAAVETIKTKEPKASVIGLVLVGLPLGFGTGFGLIGFLCSLLSIFAPWFRR